VLITTKVVSSNPAHGEVNSIQHYVIKFVSDLRQVYQKGERIRVMVFNAIFNNISVISWWSVLLVEGTEVPGENRQPVASH
jgi:hypothetical protein